MSETDKVFMIIGGILMMVFCCIALIGVCIYLIWRM